jgi:membrane fusion protein (multidrug efflux system)
VSGTVREIDFENGASVKKGSVLVRLDSSTEEAQLRSARAALSLAKISFERANRLYKAQVNAQSELDSARVKQEQAEASVANLEAVIAKKVIRAPFDGRLGIRAVELGQVVNPGSPIVSLNTVTPIYAEFLLPQQALGELKEGQQVELTVDVFPKAKWEGKLTLLNHEVDPQTRNVRIRATVDNPDGRLAPGMFGRVQVIASQAQKVLIIPQTSVVFAPYGDSVFVIEKDKKGGEKAPLVANQRFIRLGENKGDFVVVTEGLEAGETVVKDGAFKLRNGQTVAVTEANATTPKLSPEPKEE